nr:reverse transcriptase [Tanacetum cinerariifolium]
MKRKWVVGKDETLRTRLVTHHGSVVGRHLGVYATTKRLTTFFYWKGLRKMTGRQTGVVNKCLEGYLRCMTGEKPKDWVKWLPLAEYWYNTNSHSSINTTSYEVVYGQPPPLHIPYMANENNVKAMDRTLQAKEQTNQLLKFNLKNARDRMKSYADKKGTEREFKEGDWVYLKLQPYR